jgi:hypothetical protein
MIYVESFLVGQAAAILSLISALCVWMFESDSRSAGLGAVAGGIMDLLGFLTIGFVVFAAACIWMFRRLSRRSRAS